MVSSTLLPTEQVGSQGQQTPRRWYPDRRAIQIPNWSTLLLRYRFLKREIHAPSHPPGYWHQHWATMGGNGWEISKDLDPAGPQDRDLKGLHPADRSCQINCGLDMKSVATPGRGW
ncbi:hypothetical protein DSO57_1036590 [Entomophthora muscae]|uniref:Uncharacterized protein n=1 Tax=Entomophthora muscae TaxID=34485 RepID=A0ACC2UJT1_9FUNG|nr:hypothetical protein DSO57_1036590 [Entomophthora muscae]